MNNRTVKQRLAGSVAIIIVLEICLCVTTSALAIAAVEVGSNLFSTGKVEIDLNGSKPIIADYDLIFKPGMTVVKDFYIENKSTDNVYYRIYFADLSGGLDNVLEVSIINNGKVLYTGTPAELTRDNVAAADDLLKIDERRDLKMVFHFPEDAGNEYMGMKLQFTICAEATQSKNNPDKLFD